MLMELFHSVGAGALDAHGAVLRDAAEGAFRHLFLICAVVSLISPVLISGLREKELRGRMQPAASSE
jgi:hypothetical protein